MIVLSLFEDISAIFGHRPLAGLAVERVVFGVDPALLVEAGPVDRSDAVALPGGKAALLDLDQPASAFHRNNSGRIAKRSDYSVYFQSLISSDGHGEREKSSRKSAIAWGKT